jgi:hypothetical protein
MTTAASDPGYSSSAVDLSSTDWTAPGATQKHYPRALYVAVAGDIVGRLAGDTADVTFSAAGAGVLPLRFAIIRKTGTTATGLVAIN